MVLLRTVTRASVYVFVWITCTLVVRILLNIQTGGRCRKGQPPQCPVCTGRLHEDCQAKIAFESCASLTDTCATTESWDIRGILLEVTQRCIPSAQCHDDVMHCVDKYEDERFCVACNDRLKSCPLDMLAVTSPPVFGLAGCMALLSLVSKISTSFRYRSQRLQEAASAFYRRFKKPTAQTSLESVRTQNSYRMTDRYHA